MGRRGEERGGGRRRIVQGAEAEGLPGGAALGLGASYEKDRVLPYIEQGSRGHWGW